MLGPAAAMPASITLKLIRRCYQALRALGDQAWATIRSGVGAGLQEADRPGRRPPSTTAQDSPMSIAPPEPRQVGGGTKTPVGHASK